MVLILKYWIFTSQLITITLTTKECAYKNNTSIYVAHSTLEDAAYLVNYLGTNVLLAKVDIKEAYRTIPIHPAERSFLGLYWKRQMYVDCQLPFGLASTPAIFSAVGKALQWLLHQRGIQAVVHCLDDFLFIGCPSMEEWQWALSITLATCEHELTEEVRQFTGSLLNNSDRSSLCRRQFLHNVKTTLIQAKANGELFNGHSFRTGTAILDAARCPRIQDKD